MEAGLGITILPDELIDKLYYNRKLETYAVDGDLGKLTTVIAYRSDLMLSKAAKVFLEMF